MPSFELAPPMEIPKEIEYKYLLIRLPDNLDGYPYDEIKQGYLAISDEAEVRLRQKGDKHFQTVKVGSGKVRDEVEIPITEEQFEKLWSLTAGKRVEKTRYKIDLGEALVAELDIFHGDLDGLTTVEVEFKTASQADAFVPPEWFGEDVTEDKRYKNQQLALKGVPERSAEVAEEVVTTERFSSPESQIKLPEYALEEGVEELTRRIAELKDKQLESVVVLVAGGSASGKTSAVAAQIAERFGDEAVLLSMDDYYRGGTYMAEQKAAGSELNWDQPEALDLARFSTDLKQLKRGQSIQKPKYDFAVGEPTSTEQLDSKKIIVVEGLFALNDAVSGAGDVKAFVEVGTHGRVMRRLLRDIERTGQKPEDILSYFAEVVEPMNEKYIDSTAQNADIVIKNEYNPDKEARGMHEVQLKFPGTLDQGLLRSLGAERLAAVRQRDIYYQPKDRDLSVTGELLRIREENGQSVLSYKGPKIESEYRERPKFEFEIDEETREKFVEMYGTSTKTITKDRALYQLDGVVFSLDTVEKEEDGVATPLGQFVEIRTVNNRDSIALFVDRVGLSMADKDQRSYAEM